MSEIFIIVINYLTFVANLAKTMKQVCNEYSLIIITQEEGASVVMISLEDYQVMEEVLYLLRTPANAQRC
jgi:antitoxin YefM